MLAVSVGARPRANKSKQLPASRRAVVVACGIAEPLGRLDKPCLRLRYLRRAAREALPFFGTLLVRRVDLAYLIRW